MDEGNHPSAEPLAEGALGLAGLVGTTPLKWSGSGTKASPRTYLLPDQRPHWTRVSRALSEGQLGPLADYLNVEKPDIDPHLAKQIVDFIRGTPQDTGWRLQLTNHPDVTRREKKREERLAGWRLARQMAFWIAANRGFERSNYKRVMAMAAEHFGLSEHTIRKRVKPWRDLAVRRQRALETLRRQLPKA